MSKVSRIISGGQTGIDRSALDVAIELGISHSGWCPKGRRAEDGTIPQEYLLIESPSAGYADRTRRNVCSSTATLILSYGPPEKGTRLTWNFAIQYKKPCMLIDLGQDLEPQFHACRNWLQKHQVQILNVAGPRESRFPGISDRAKDFLLVVLIDN